MTKEAQDLRPEPLSFEIPVGSVGDLLPGKKSYVVSPDSLALKALYSSCLLKKSMAKTRLVTMIAVPPSVGSIG